MIAPNDVTIPAGPTGLDPKQTPFFQNLNISTRIIKAQIDIAVNKQVIWKGDKISQSQASLLDKLNIYPFEYRMEVKKVLLDGNLFDGHVLEITDQQIHEKFKQACQL